MTKILIAVFLGGGTGSLLRYCVQMALHERIVPYSFPWATFAVNITGSFLIGLFYGSTHVADHRIVRRLHHLFHILQ